MSLSYAMTNVFFKSISNQVIGILKGNWSLRRRQRLPLRNSCFAITPSNSLVFGGEMSIKQKDFTTTTKFKNLVLSKSLYHLVSYCVQKGEKVVFQKWYIKTLLNTKRWISFRGSFV